MITARDLILARKLGGSSTGGSGITPSGTLEITENGSYDVTNYAKAEVNVEASGGDSGGGLKSASGTVVPAEDMTILKVTGLDFTPKFFFIRTDKDTVTDGVAKLAGAIYCYGAKIQVRTNSNGSSLSGVDLTYLFSDYEVLPDNTQLVGTGVLENGLYIENNSYKFKAGYTYTWEAWG